jgi:hypothetical protein
MDPAVEDEGEDGAAVGVRMLPTEVARKPSSAFRTEEPTAAAPSHTRFTLFGTHPFPRYLASTRTTNYQYEILTNIDD